METPRTSSPLVLCVTGPESTGKTRLAHALAARLDCACVEEFVREYAMGKSFGRGPWLDLEFVLIAEEQGRRQAEAVSKAPRDGVVICDTDPFTVWVWHQFYVDHPLEEITELAEDFAADLYVLPSYLDTEFVPDGIRDMPLERAELHERFRSALSASGSRFIEVSGTIENRLARVLAELADLRPMAD